MNAKDQEFREFFQAEFRPLRRLGYLLTGDWAEAEDLAQEAMVRTYRAWGRITERDRPGAYARSILVNRRRSLLRRSAVAAKHAEMLRAPEYQPAMGEEAMVLWEAIRSLPQRQRAAIVLRFYEDMSEADVAAVLEMPVGTVKSLVHRGVGKLREKLGPGWQTEGIPGGSDTP
ncbi:MAG TPA: SigE family RNA polymerase sigma factor [Actinomycetota bacterium]|nr:SigE family RNA polymerase sigma factor [Actinomycetota bacterium]